MKFLYCKVNSFLWLFLFSWPQYSLQECWNSKFSLKPTFCHPSLSDLFDCFWLSSSEVFGRLPSRSYFLQECWVSQVNDAPRRDSRSFICLLADISWSWLLLFPSSSSQSVEEAADTGSQGRRRTTVTPHHHHQPSLYSQHKTTTASNIITRKKAKKYF